MLRKVAEDIPKDYPQLSELLINMYETLDASEGIGLAAPQVGLPIRVVIIDLDVISEDLPEYMHDCREYMLQRGFTAEMLNSCGCRYTYQRNYELIFPMYDNGKFRGWVSRTRIPEVAEKRKYLYNEGFRRATTVVGEYRNCSTVYIVEGYMDRLKLVQLGIPNAVAILGWKASNQQIQRLQAQGIRHVISALDNDDCGRKGTEWLRKHFVVTRFRYLKGIKDPGDFTSETFERMNARTLREFKADESRRVKGK